MSPNRSLLRIGVILGIGIVGTLDQVVLHELLQWHHFYVKTSQHWRLFIDGLFHLSTAGFLTWGAVELWLNRSLIRLGEARALAAGVLFGMGGFNLYDGIVQHKILQLHPVREHVANILPYDLAFNGLALLMLGAGYQLWQTVRTPLQ